MSIFLTNPHLYSLMRQQATAKQRMELVAQWRQRVVEYLTPISARFPLASERHRELLVTKEVPATWDLSNDDQAVVFCVALLHEKPTVEEAEAAKILRACVHAKEIGDVPEFKDMQTGRQYAEAQRNKATDRKYEKAEQKRIAALYRAAKDQHGAVKALAGRFDVTTQTIRDIAKRNPPD